MGALSATAQPKYHAGIEPIVPGFIYAPFGDLDAVKQLVDDETCAIMLEPIQGEGGVNPVPNGFLEGLRELCDSHGMLLILDEVQTGMGRTGTWFAHQHWNVVPDIVTLAKGIAGGIAFGGLIAKDNVAAKMVPGTHAATFGGNPISCRAALATIETIEEEGLLERATLIGKRFHKHFSELQERSPLIAEIRIKGAMIGVELNIEGAPLVQRCIENGLLINCTHGTVLRLLARVEFDGRSHRSGM